MHLPLCDYKVSTTDNIQLTTGLFKLEIL